MDLINLQPSVPRSCEIPLNRAPTPSHSEPYYTSHRPLPHVLYKSMSSNNILPTPAPFYCSRGALQQMRPWRYPSSSTTRPVGLPYSISQQSLSCRAGCHCQCDCSRKQVSDFQSLFEKQMSCFTVFYLLKNRWVLLLPRLMKGSFTFCCCLRKRLNFVSGRCQTLCFSVS
jgi:hypothetical protein